ncbi:MAG: ABC transporter ATP-binding protein [Candidatus Hydrogenedentes bacterium]|nr:ABC transporter ATP-binding protein [Candidatus Hydrogenedentota bacterium]
MIPAIQNQGDAGAAAMWRYFIGLYRGSYPRLSLGVLVSAMQCVLVLPIAFLIKYAFDVLVPAQNVPGLVTVGAALVLLQILNSATALWVRHVILNTTKAAIQRLREDLLQRCCLLPRAFFDRADRATLHASIVQDTERLDVMSNALAAMFLPALVISAGLCVILVLLNPLLFLTMVTVAPPLLLMGQLMKRQTRRRVQAFHRSFEAFSRGVLFVLEHMDLVRLQTAEGFETARQQQRFEDIRRTSGAMAWLTTAYTTVQKGISTVSGILILVVGGISVAHGSMTIGGLLSFYAAAALVNHYVAIMLVAAPQIIEGTEALRTVFRLARLDAPLPYSGEKQLEFAGNIALDAVDFHYDERPVLRGVDLEIAPGRMVALVGPNGAGKTTIIHLVLGFYRPQHGRLLADGQDYSELDMRHLRGKIGVVTQDPVLFPGSILENITYGSPGVDFAAVVRAATLAAAHEFIDLLPQGYQTPAGEDGLLLSGGQRQRISLARALLRRPRLLILDEPTTHLDAAAAAHLLDSLKGLDDRPAVLCITHDMELAREADEVYVLGAEGRIAAAGPPVQVFQDGLFQGLLEPAESLPL